MLQPMRLVIVQHSNHSKLLAPCVHVLFRRELVSSTDPFIKMFNAEILKNSAHVKCSQTASEDPH
jgi:hypothetical protein